MLQGFNEIIHEKHLHNKHLMNVSSYYYYYEIIGWGQDEF